MYTVFGHPSRVVVKILTESDKILEIFMNFVVPIL